MNHPSLSSLALLALVLLVGCQDSSPPSAGPSNPESSADAAPPSVELEDYPRLYETYRDSEADMEGTSPLSLPASPAVLELVEERFRIHLALPRPESSTAFGIERDQVHSLMIEVAAGSGDDSPTLVAVWRKREPQDDGSSRLVIRRSAQPLPGEAEAIALLKAFAGGDEKHETLVE